jgi:hypothetical protein
MQTGPNIPYGKVPNSDFASNDNPYANLRVGVIMRVDEFNLKADVRVITGSEDRYELDLIQPLAGPRSFLGGIPEVGAMVIIGYRRKNKQFYEAVILGYLPVGNKLGLRFDPFAPVPPGEIEAGDESEVAKLYGPTIRYKRIKGKSGDIVGMSAAGSEFQLSEDVRLINRGGDTIELRDVDRTLVTQAIHRVESDSAAYMFSGAVRRGAMNLPLEIFEKDSKGVITNVVRGTDTRYFGRDDLSLAGVPGSTFIDPGTNKALDRINDGVEFPPLTFSNGRQVFYASSNPATNFEDPTHGGSLRAFTERRIEVRHDTDLEQEVLEEIDGFGIDRPRAYIEYVLGTLVGNDPFSTLGQRQYGKVLKPKIFETFDQRGAPSGFSLEECLRPPSTAVDEAMNMAAAYLLKISSPRAASRNPFAVAVSKQGKLFVNIPASSSENYSSKNVSAEVNLEGCLKAHIGANSPERYSIHLTCDGGIFLDVGSDATGQCITTNFRGAIKNIFRGGSNSVDDVAHSIDVQGDTETHVSGTDLQVVKGSYQKTVDGNYTVKASTVNLHGLNGFNSNVGGWNTTVSGKTQNYYAMLYQETVALGGKVCTILAGGHIENILAGAKTTTVAAGAVAVNCPAGAYSVTVGTGAISITTAVGAVSLSTGLGAISMTAGLGAVAITAGLAMNLTATTMISLTAPRVALGGPVAVLGVARGTPMMPPNTPSLDWVTGLPLMGSLMVSSV